MSDFTREELEQMLTETDEQELSASLVPTADEITISEIMSANDCTKYTLRDNDRFNKIVYSYEQSATVGKRITTWIKYTPVVENGVTTTYARTQISQSFSTDLNENYSQTELIIEE